ncbi:MAG TPA: NAD(P)-dependent oxidoreductase [Myxococcota bacterium]|nr:NAD(P)-dependent oxidoreductase [Myxococcota bacterium]
MALRAGFIGLGNIGKPMARRLVSAGLETTVLDLAEAPVRELVAAGAKAAATPRAAAAASDYLGICVRDDADLASLMAGADGVLAGAAPGTVVAVHSTVLPRTVERFAAQAAPRDVAVLDACITGGAPGAAQGTLTVMIGGDAAAIDRIRPALAAFARTVVHAGPLGAGAKLKLCNNLMTYLAWTAAQEATALAKAAGLSDEVFEEVTRSNGNLTEPMRAFLALHRAPEATRRSPGFQALLRSFVDLAEKDLAATLALAREHHVALPGAAVVSQIMARVYGLDDEGRR